MVYVLSLVGVLLVAVLVGLIILMVASRMHDNLEDIDDDECDDPEPDPYVHSVPPFAILQLGLSGQHDRYPISDGLRRMWIAHLDASWSLPEREPGATR